MKHFGDFICNFFGNSTMLRNLDPPPFSNGKRKDTSTVFRQKNVKYCTNDSYLPVYKYRTSGEHGRNSKNTTFQENGKNNLPERCNSIKITTKFFPSRGHFTKKTRDAISLGRYGVRHTCCGHYSKTVMPRNFVGGGSTNSVEDRGQKEWKSGGGNPLVRGSTQFANA
jgi:hypothetical protein